MRTSLLTLPSLRPSSTSTGSRPVLRPVTRAPADLFVGTQRDAQLEALARNLGSSFDAAGLSSRDVRSSANALTRTLYSPPESFADTDALVRSGALSDAVRSLGRGQSLPLVQRFSSMSEAKQTLGLTPHHSSTKHHKKSFWSKAWNTITRSPTKKQPFWKKALAVGGASLAFSLFDYIGFNIARKSGKVGLYRPLQIATQAGLTFWLKEHFGWKTAGAFNALWWTFNHDLLYYGWGELLNPGNGWDGKGNLKGLVNGDLKVTWAWWTPAGLTNMLGEGTRSDPLSGRTLLIQAGVGAAVALTLLALE